MASAVYTGKPIQNGSMCLLEALPMVIFLSWRNVSRYVLHCKERDPADLKNGQHGDSKLLPTSKSDIISIWSSTRHKISILEKFVQSWITRYTDMTSVIIFSDLLAKLIWKGGNPVKLLSSHFCRVNSKGKSKLCMLKK